MTRAWARSLEILLILSVLSSASASTQTTILPTARTSLAMGAFKALPSAFAKIHPKYLTPTVSTIWMGIVSILFYVGMTVVSENILSDTIAAVGLMIAFYYGLTGFAAVWFYRHHTFDSVRDFFMKGLWPFLGGVMLLGAFIIASYQYARPGLRHDQPLRHRWGVRHRHRVTAAGRGADVHLERGRASLLPG